MSTRLPTRVLMTTDAGGASWSYGLELARGLRGRGVHVVLAAMGPAPNHAQREAAAAAGVRLEHAPLDLEWMDDPWEDLADAGDWLLELEARHGCDVVHLNGYAHAHRAFRGPKVVVAHSCVLSWWDAVFGEQAPARWARYADVVSEGLAAAAHVVTPTRWMRSTLERHYGALTAPASIIHNARPPGGYGPAEKQPYVLGVGGICDEAKNLAALGRAGRGLSWPVKIAGPRASLPATDFSGVELVGKLAEGEMASLYAGASIFAAPVRYEPFGLTILEAALSGCALVLGDIPGLRELWEDAAVFVPRDDDAAIETCLRDLIRHPEMRLEMGAEARARALTFRFDEMVDAYLNVYAAAARDAVARDEALGCAS